MLQEYSAGAVIFRKEKDRVLFLILHYEEGHWGCPKGHIEENETIEKTARREICEETGLTAIRFIGGFKEINRYSFTDKGRQINKTVFFLLAETAESRIKLSDEHQDSAWLPAEEALQRITYEGEREIMRKAIARLASL